jgi:hypothetical protein
MGSSPARTLAAAAACFLAVGVAVVQIWATFGPQPGPTPVARVAFPVSSAVEMIRTHDNCAKLPDHHLVPGDDPTALLRELTHMRNAPITPINLAGWQFKGAGTCTVGQTQGAHLLFARGSDRISIFSLPAPHNCAHGTSPLYREAVDGHAVTGFVFGGSVYGVVGSGSSGSSGQAMLTQIDALTSQVENCVGASSCEGLGAGMGARR